MRNVLKTFCALAAVLALYATAPAAEPTSRPTRQTVTGLVEDAAGKRVSGASVFILDAVTGVPYSQVSDRPFSEPGFGNEGPPIAFGTTGGDGRFHIRGVFPGNYRLLALSWPGLESPTKLIDAGSDAVTLHGVLDPFPVTDEKSARAGRTKPAGSATVVVKTETDALFVLVSTHPPAGDLILGPLAIYGDFARHLLAITYSKGNAVTFSGLPEGKLYVFAVRNDRNASLAFGEVTATAGQSAEVTLKLTQFGNEPVPVPARLAPLVELLEKDKKVAGEALRKAVGDAAGGPRQQQSMLDMGPKLTIEVDLPDGQRATVAELLAASSYLDTNRQAEARKAQKP